MNGIIGEVNTLFEYSEEVSKEGAVLYNASIDGCTLVALDYFLDNDIPFKSLIKVGKDMQGEMIIDYLTSTYGIEEEDILISSNPTTVIIDGTLLIRGTASSNIKRDEVLSFLDEKRIDKLYISSLLLSLDPVRNEIIQAIEMRKERINIVVIDGEDPTKILMLEDLFDSVGRIKNAVKDCYLMGEAFTLDGVKRIGKDNLKDLFV